VKRLAVVLALCFTAIANCLWAVPSLAATSRPLVSEATARSVVSRIFPLWQHDMHEGDAQALRHIETGIQLELDTSNCTTTAYVLFSRCSASPMLGLVVIVPKQYSYPVRVLAEVQTSQNTENTTTNATQEAPTLDLMVFTKATSTASWLIAFQTAVYSANRSLPPLMSAPKESDGHAPAVTRRIQRATAGLPGKLAEYWRAWKEHGAAPDDTAFLPGPDTTSFGATLASEPDGVVGQNLRHTVTYSSEPSVDGSFVFPIEIGEFTSNPTPGGIGYAGNSGLLVCSAIRVEINLTPTPNGPPLIQDRNEINFGPGLAPGRYSNVLDESAHESCVLTDGHHLSAIGNAGDVFSQIGEKHSRAV
jgi:hypothetical protein